MPQIETLMLIALGFCLAAAVAVIAVRTAWKFSAQMNQRRANRAEADLKTAEEVDEKALKSEYAALRRKFELKVEDYKTQLAEQLAELSRARNHIEELRNTHAEACKKHEARRTEIAEYKGTIATLTSAAAERDKDMVALEEQIAKNKKSSQKLTDTVSGLRKDLQNAHADTDKLKAEIAAEQAHSADLIEASAAKEDRYIAMDARAAELEASAAGREQVISTKTNEIASLTQDLDLAREDNKKLHTTVRQLSDDLTARTRSLEEAKNDIQRIAQEKSTTEDRLDAVTAVENERLGTLSRLEQELKHRDDDLARANRDLGELQSAKAAVEQARDAARQEIEVRTSQIEQLQGEVANARSDLEARDSIVALLRKQIASHETSLAALNEEMTALRSRANTLTPSPEVSDTSTGNQLVQAMRKKATASAEAPAPASTGSQPLAARIRSLQQVIVNP